MPIPQPYRRFLPLIACAGLLGITACRPPEPPAAPSFLVGVMMDNHEDAMPHQRGLEKAIFVQEQFVEGFITRFLAVFDTGDLPASVGPIRSVRPYFVDGTSPMIEALFHAGGSPEGLDRIAASPYATGFNALRLDNLFEYDTVAPAPHNRYLTEENMRTLLARIENPVMRTGPLFRTGPFTQEEPATAIRVNYRNPVHNVSYAYDPATRAYLRTNGTAPARDTPATILILETTVMVPGPYGRLAVTMQGEGAALLFRDGGMTRARWSKTGEEEFFTFTDGTGNPLPFADGQVWMTVVDDLKRVTWAADGN